MKNKKFMIGFVILFFSVLSMTMVASAIVYPTYDNETDCRGCHGNDVTINNVATRHHLLAVNGTHQCTDCHPVQFDNVTQKYSTQIIRNCLICHPGKNHNNVHHILASQGLFVCSDCHPMKFNNVTQTYYPYVTWDCTVCHSTVLSIQNIVPTPTPTPTPVPTPTVQSAMITSFTPDSPVANFVGDSKSFHITTDQVTDVIWSINGTPVQSNGSVADVGYTNTSATLGTWNVSVTASNINGNVTYTWEWIVATPPPPTVAPTINSNFPLYPSVNDSVGMSRKFGIAVDQNVSIQWLINGNQMQLDGNVNASSYNNTSAALGTWNVSAIASNNNGTVMYSWIWNVYPPPTITSSSPISPVNDTSGTPRIFNITTDQIVNVTWYINGAPIQSNDSVTDALYDNISASPGTWNVSTIATNDNGSVMNSWIWNVTSISSSPPAIIGYAPTSPVNDTADSARAFNITIDQTANVTWYLNGTFIKTDTSITYANYTNTSAKAGIWNVSVIVTNPNGSTIKSWTWNVEQVYQPPGIVSYSPSSLIVNDTEGSSRTFNITTNQTTNVVWYINNSTVQSDNGVINSSYINTSANPGKWIVKVIVTNPSGNVTRSWTWNVTSNPKPITIIDPPTGKNGWYVNNTIYLNATDSDGIKYTSYSVDGGEWISHQGISATPSIAAILPIGVRTIRYSIYSLTLKTPVVLPSDGNHTIQYYSVDNLNGTESTKTKTVKVDTTPPRITINSPINGGIYILKQNLIANWSVNDTTSGKTPAIATYANGSVISTTSVGTKIFSVNSSDNAGNTNKTNVTYYIRYKFGGFLQPIDTDGRSEFKQPSKIDIRFKLSDINGVNVATATAKLSYNNVSSTITGDDLKPITSDTATTGGNFKYDSKNMWYYYNLDSKLLKTGTWQITADINDGSSYTMNISIQQ